MISSAVNNSIKSIAMRGILVKKFGGEDVLTVDHNIPLAKPKDDEVLVKVVASGVNPVDTYIRLGAYAVLPELPYVPGKDGAGIIESIGSGVSNFKIGDRVFCSDTSRMGTLAEYTIVHKSKAFPLDDKLSFNEGAGLGIPYFTAYHALLHKGKAVKKERVLVHGASGAVGLAACQIAKAYGMVVVGTAGTDEGVQLVQSMGVDEVYNHKDKNYQSEMTKNGNFDVILEMLANVNLQSDLNMMNQRGRTVVIGCRGDIQISPRLMMGKESCVVGCALFSSNEAEWKEQTEAIVKGIKDGWVKPVIDKVYELDQTKNAHHDVMNSKGAKGKLIVKISDA